MGSEVHDLGEAETSAPSQGHRKRLGWVVGLLYIGLAMMVIAVLSMLLMAVIFMVPSEFRDSLFDGVDASLIPPMGKMALACFGSAIAAGAWFVVLQILLRIVRTVQAGDPFIEANIGRLRWMWIIIAVTELFRMFVYSAADIALGGANVAPADNGIDISLGTWFLVFIIATLSEAFRYGAEMRREQELTI